MDKKAQGAGLPMEMLVKVGWKILLLLIVIGIIYAIKKFLEANAGLP